MTVVPLPAEHVAGNGIRAADVSAPDAVEPRYVGLVTRGIAFALDAAVIDLVAIVVGLGASLILALFHIGQDLKTVLVVAGGVAVVLWSIGYFVAFWSTTGQTPGNRVMQFRILGTDGKVLKPRRALVRVGGLVLAALPLFAGYLLILFDDRRRGLQDRIARTVVVETAGSIPPTTGRPAPPLARP